MRLSRENLIIYGFDQHYLQERKQSVVIDGVTSAEATMSCGVPQGSVLGPL